MGSRINTVMQPCFFQLAGILPADEAIARIKGFVEKTYAQARRGHRRAQLRRDRPLARAPRPRPAAAEVTNGRSTTPPVPGRRPRLRRPGHVAADRRRRRPAAGQRAAGRRDVPDRDGQVREAGDRPDDPDLGPAICIDCGKCAMVCPHATIRMKVLPDLPRSRPRRPTSCTRSSAREDLPDHRLTDPGRARRLHRLRRLRRRLPGQEQDRHEPQGDQHGARRASTATSSAPRWDFFQSIPPLDREPDPARFGQGLAGRSSRSSSSRAPAPAAARRPTSGSSASCSATA